MKTRVLIAAAIFSCCINLLPTRSDALEFFEYFSPNEIVLESNYEDNALDNILKRHYTNFLSKVPNVEEGLISELGNLLSETTQINFSYLLNKSKDKCISLKNNLYSCIFYRYRITRAPGSSSHPRLICKYVYELTYKNSGKSLKMSRVVFKFEVQASEAK